MSKNKSDKPGEEDIEEAKATKDAKATEAAVDSAKEAAKEDPEAVTVTATGEVKKDKEAK